jgi:hypothetical protein
MLIDSVPPATAARTLTEHDPLGAVGNRLEPGRAKAVDGDGGCLDGNAGAQARDARDVHALFALGHRAADDHVVDRGRIRGQGTRSRAALIAAAPSSSGRITLSVPFGAFPTAVRMAETMTASCMMVPYVLTVLKSASRSSTASATIDVLPSNRLIGISIVTSSFGSGICE